MEFKDWITQTKTDKPELADFLNRAEKFFVESGFEAAKFEKAVTTGLAGVEREVIDSLKIESDAADQKNND